MLLWNNEKNGRHRNRISPRFLDVERARFTRIKKRKFIHGVTFKDLEDFKNKETAFKEILREVIILDDMNEKSIFSEILQAGRKKK
ncbi:MAG: hypothetical protein U5M51_01670 [Emticicia sp.]|nr:hypothetical protein [Emticicia sp.]